MPLMWHTAQKQSSEPHKTAVRGGRLTFQVNACKIFRDCLFHRQMVCMSWLDTSSDNSYTYCKLDNTSQYGIFACSLANSYTESLGLKCLPTAFCSFLNFCSTILS